MQLDLENLESTSAEHQWLLQQLCHEIRQPLSGIESTAFYLEMAFGDAEPEIQDHCGRLRRMVQHAHWLVEDTAISLRLALSPCGAVSLGETLTRIGGEMALHEEHNLELQADADAPPAWVPAALSEAFCRHVLSFFRGIAQAEDPIRATVVRDGDGVRLVVGAEVNAECEDLARLLDPPGHGGGVRRYVEAARGQLTVSAEDRRLHASFRFPAAE